MVEVEALGKDPLGTFLKQGVALLKRREGTFSGRE